MRHLKSQGGFTFIELIVAATFIAGMAAAIVTLFIGLERMTQHSKTMAIATSELQNKIEGYRDAGYNALPTGGEDFTGSLPASLGPNRSGTTSVTQEATNLRKVTVTVKYSYGQQTKTLNATTLMAEQGINR